MSCDSSFKKKVILECCDALERHGFKRFRKLSVDYPLHDGFHCWVGLNAALFPNRVELVPNVGLHVVAIEKMICALDRGEYSSRYDRGVATYAINIGQLDGMENERSFVFSPTQSSSFIADECERLASLYALAGINYAKSIASYELLAPLLNSTVDGLGGVPERYATCLYLMGQKVKAQEFLTTFPESYRKYIDGFAIPFLEKIQAEISSSNT